MKLSNETINVLKNFANINTNILIRKGNQIKTISTNKGMFAVATVAETFPKEFGVYDLSTLISLFTLVEDYDITFGDQSMMVNKNNGSFEYYYASPNILVIAPDKTIEFDSFYKFKLTDSELNLLLKAASIVSATTITIKSDGKKVYIVAGDPKINSSNSYKLYVGDSEEKFNCNVPTENLNILSDSYEITLSKKKMVHMKGESKRVEYFIACEPDSTFGETS